MPGPEYENLTDADLARYVAEAEELLERTPKMMQSEAFKQSTLAAGWLADRMGLEGDARMAFLRGFVVGQRLFGRSGWDKACAIDRELVERAG